MFSFFKKNPLFLFLEKIEFGPDKLATGLGISKKDMFAIAELHYDRLEKDLPGEKVTTKLFETFYLHTQNNRKFYLISSDLITSGKISSIDEKEYYGSYVLSLVFGALHRYYFEEKFNPDLQIENFKIKFKVYKELITADTSLAILQHYYAPITPGLIVDIEPLRKELGDYIREVQNYLCGFSNHEVRSYEIQSIINSSLKLVNRFKR